jgi:hypothetical protein
MTQVILKGGYIGAVNKVVAEFEIHEEAKAYAKRRRATLSPGEKSYYGMSYVVKKVKEKVASQR